MRSACARRRHPCLESEAVLFSASPVQILATSPLVASGIVTTYWRPTMALCSHTDILNPKLSSYRPAGTVRATRYQMCSVRVSLRGMRLQTSWKAADLSAGPLLGSEAMCKSPCGCQDPVLAGSKNTQLVTGSVCKIDHNYHHHPPTGLPICQPPSLLVFKFLGTSLPQDPGLFLHTLQLVAEAR